MSMGGHDVRAAEREALLARIRGDAQATSPEVAEAVMWPGVLEALSTVPREDFVDAALSSEAYCNAPLPIGHQQTISQPFIVALMTGLLAPRAGDRVLEIGTGSGYQAAVLSRLVGAVYSVEIVPQLAERARAALAGQGIANVHVRIGDGHQGWPEEAPFDGIIITAAAAEIPAGLLAQMKPGGRMVLPLGQRRQMLVVVEKAEDGTTSVHDVIGVRFVPFVEAAPPRDRR